MRKGYLPLSVSFWRALKFFKTILLFAKTGWLIHCKCGLIKFFHSFFLCDGLQSISIAKTYLLMCTANLQILIDSLYNNL